MLYCIESESMVLSAIMLDNSVLKKISLSADEFYYTANQLIYSAMHEMFSEGVPIDMLSLNNRLKCKGILKKCGDSAYLTKIVSTNPTAANVTYYSKQIHSYYVNRMLSQHLDILKDDLENGASKSDIFSRIEAMNRYNISDGDSFVHIKSCLDRSIDRTFTPNTLTVYDTGLLELDKYIGNMKPGEYVCIAARPGMGKTMLALNILWHNACKGIPCGMVCYEMLDLDLTERIFCSETGSSLHEISRKLYTGEDIGRVCNSWVAKKAMMLETPLFFDTSSSRYVEDIAPKIRGLVRDKGVKLVAVDYVQQMFSKRRTTAEHHELTAISGQLKSLAMELGIVIIVLSQLSRQPEGRTNKRPVLSDLKGSGSLEQDANKVLLLYRDEIYNKDTEEKGIAEIFIAKNRQGNAGGIIKTAFLGANFRFADLAKEY